MFQVIHFPSYTKGVLPVTIILGLNWKIFQKISVVWFIEIIRRWIFNWFLFDSVWYLYNLSQLENSNFSNTLLHPLNTLMKGWVLRFYAHFLCCWNMTQILWLAPSSLKAATFVKKFILWWWWTFILCLFNSTSLNWFFFPQKIISKTQQIARMLIAG